MSKTVCCFMKGMGMGVAVGCTAGVVATCYLRKNRKGLRRNAGRAVRTLGDLLDSVTGMF